MCRDSTITNPCPLPNFSSCLINSTPFQSCKFGIKNRKLKSFRLFSYPENYGHDNLHQKHNEHLTACVNDMSNRVQQKSLIIHGLLQHPEPNIKKAAEHSAAFAYTLLKAPVSYLTHKPRDKTAVVSSRHSSAFSCWVAF